MPVSVTNANLVVKDKNGNTGVVKTLTAADVTKLNNAISDVAVVVDPTTHVARPATTSSTGVVQLADAAAISAGTPGRVVDAAQLQAASSAISVDSTYVEPAARTGIISSASDLLTAPGGSTPVTKDYVDLTSAQTVGGVKTFTALPRASTVPTADDQLANKKYVDDTGANHVTLDTEQTITGQKYFTRDLIYAVDSSVPGNVDAFNVTRPTFDAGETPSTSVYTTLACVKDKDGNYMGTAQVGNLSSGSVETYLTARKKVDGTMVRADLRIGMTSDGSPYTYAPNPAAGDNSQNIATTHFVHNELASYATLQPVLYVDPVSGSDSNNGKSVATAFKTITKAIAVCNSGRTTVNNGRFTIHLAAGTYPETINIDGGRVFLFSLDGDVVVNVLGVTNSSACEISSNSSSYSFTAKNYISVYNNSFVRIYNVIQHVYTAQINVGENSELRNDSPDTVVTAAANTRCCQVGRGHLLCNGAIEFIGNNSDPIITISQDGQATFDNQVTISGTCTSGIRMHTHSLLVMGGSSSFRTTYLDYTATTSGRAIELVCGCVASFAGAGEYSLHVHAAVTGTMLYLAGGSVISRTGGSAPMVLESTAASSSAAVYVYTGSSLSPGGMSITSPTSNDLLHVEHGIAYFSNLTINSTYTGSTNSALVTVYANASVYVANNVSLTSDSARTTGAMVLSLDHSSFTVSGAAGDTFTVNGGCEAVFSVNYQSSIRFHNASAPTLSGTITHGRAYSVGTLSEFIFRDRTVPAAADTTPTVDTVHFGVAY